MSLPTETEPSLNEVARFMMQHAKSGRDRDFAAFLSDVDVLKLKFASDRLRAEDVARTIQQAQGCLRHLTRLEALEELSP